MGYQGLNKITAGLSILYFTIIILYSIDVFIGYQPLKFALGFIRIPVLMILYFYSSKERNFIYFLALFFYQIASLLLSKDAGSSLFYGAIASVLFRFLLVVLVYKAIEEKKWVMIIIASLPFLWAYLYLVDLVKDSLSNDLYPWLLNGFLTAFLGGLSVGNYYFKDDKKSYWLLISCLLFVIQIGMFLINKFYLRQQLFLQLGIIFYGISHYTFYKFMIKNEEER
ncbi:hypothetical protein [Flavobacterium sp. GT3R68]|uniref:hypothetical protein n=1 Tax=Flavobacterium sp. GT3R68 TaxID=2594437 RepID=UPI000F894557|nr:hypothetical protein [Flavobacterium sp. GT3R68]RTY95013.1 hypothetical protein EKL32_08840 [Flavobacterium sp. GSN2]TRW91819.1 hypothetical protein FNW07_08015 [Flavobacterium sp. GT3R68]